MTVQRSGWTHPRTSWDALALLGAILWPVGLFGFGGFDEDAGAAIVAAGCVLVLGSLAVECALRSRAGRRLIDRA